MSGLALGRAVVCAAVLAGVAGTVHAAIPSRTVNVPVPVNVPDPVSRSSPPSSLDPAAPDDVSSELQIMVGNASLLEGDAPGTDSAIAPRPQGSTRLLDAPLGASGARIRVYSTTRALDDVMRENANLVVGRGFERDDSGGDPRTVSYRRDTRHLVARFSLREDRVLVSLVEMELRSAED